jgi:transmembrane sensor
VSARIGKRYSHEVYEQACEWFVEFRAGAVDEATRQAFCAWLQQAPAHMTAYLEVASRWNRAGTLDMSARFSKEALIAEASDTDNLVPFPGAAAPARDRQRPLWLRPARISWAAGALVLIGTGLITLWIRSGTTSYATGIGQKRTITLADGSVVDLNARSRIIVRYNRHQREIDLVRGQALFADTFEANRPFIVRTRATVVRAIGTQFDVNLLRAEAIVTVIEGKVVVARPRPTGAPATNRLRQSAAHGIADRSRVYLTAGQQVTVSPTRRLQPVAANTRDAIAWVHRKLIFASTELRNVVQEFNRYNARHLVITSPSLEKFRIDGVFASTNPDSLIAFLRQYPGIKVTEVGGRVLIARQVDR